MVALSASTPKFDMGRVVRQTFSLIGQNWVLFGLLAILLMVAPQTIWAVALRLTGHGFPAGLSGYQSTWFWATALINQATDAALLSGQIFAAMATIGGQRLTLGNCLRAAIRFFPSVFLIQLGFAVALVVGLACFVVPGVMIGLSWMMAVPAEIGEQTGIVGSFRRSADLTARRRNELLALTAAFLLLSIILALGQGAAGWLIISARMSWAIWPVFALRPVLNGLLRTVAAVGLTAIYFELRLLKEGVGPGQLATVFD